MTITAREFVEARLAEEKRPGTDVLAVMDESALRRTAALYADHPDYQNDWKP